LDIPKESAPVGSGGDWPAWRRDLDRRMARIEAALGLAGPGEASPSSEAGRADASLATSPASPPGLGLERRIGEFVLAQVGIVALILAAGFFVTYLYGTVSPWISVPVAAILVGGLLGLAAPCRKAYPPISETVFTGSLLLLFYTVLRLTFFIEAPIVREKSVGIALLAAVLVAMVWISVVRKTQYLAGISLLLGFATALTADAPGFTLSAIALLSAASAVLRLRYDWDALIVVALVGAYASHLIWLLGNPLLGHPLRMVADPHHNIYFLFVYAAIFAVGNLFRSRDLALETSNILLSLFNAGGFYLISALVIFTYQGDRAGAFHLGIAAFFLGAGMVYWLYRRSFYSASFYALTGLFALSVAIHMQFSGAMSTMLLGWQSVLVVWLAVWFRSRIIAVANLAICTGIYLFSLAAEPASAGVNLNFAAVAVLSFWLLQRYREPLGLSSPLFAYAYLVFALVVTPVGLYLAVPAEAVSVAWLGASLVYFGLGLVLRERALRVVAITFLLLTVGHVFLIDLAQLEPVYRVLSFLALGVVLVATSLTYARHHRVRRSRAQSAASATGETADPPPVVGGAVRGA
jgi:hypothetical protein